jgi:hypothetical protein
MFAFDLIVMMLVLTGQIQIAPDPVIAAQVIRRSDLPDPVKGRVLMALIRKGMGMQDVRRIFGEENRPSKFSTGPIIIGIYWYSCFKVVVDFGADGKVSGTRFLSP